MEKLITEKKQKRENKKALIKKEFEMLINRGAMKMPAYEYLSKKYKLGYQTIMRYVNK